MRQSRCSTSNWISSIHLINSKSSFLLVSQYFSDKFIKHMIHFSGCGWYKSFKDSVISMTILYKNYPTISRKCDPIWIFWTYFKPLDNTLKLVYLKNEVRDQLPLCNVPFLLLYLHMVWILPYCQSVTKRSNHFAPDSKNSPNQVYF